MKGLIRFTQLDLNLILWVLESQPMAFKWGDCILKKHLRKITLAEICKMIWSGPAWRQRDGLRGYGNSSEDNCVQL